MALKPCYAMLASDVAKQMNYSEAMINKLEQSAMRKLRRSALLYTLYIESQCIQRSGTLGTLCKDEMQGEEL